MDLCKYAYYKKEEKYFPHLYCSIGDKYCMYSKKCLKVEKFVPIENEQWRECYKFIMKEKENIPKNSCLIQSYRYNKRGELYLYVIIEDNSVKIKTTLKELKQNYIYIKKVSENNYDISLTPFVDEYKQKYNRKYNNKNDEK